jgi:hypothetical protein
MRKNVAVMLALIFLTASSLMVAKPAFSSADVAEDSWVSKAPMNKARCGLGVVAVNGKIYAIGGSTAGGFVGTNEEYDPTTDTWTYKASMPTPRDHFAIVAYKNRIYCIGGAVGFTVDEYGLFHSYVVSGVNEVYDTVTGTWEAKKSLPYSGMEMQAHVVDGKIYVMDWSYVYVYDPESDSWGSKTRMPPPYPESSQVSAVVGNKIVVTGEFAVKPYYVEVQKVMIYDMVTDSWSEGTPGPSLVLAGAAGATVGVNALQRVYVLGLSSGNQVYDPKADSWASGSAMPTTREYFGVAVVNDILYAIGGNLYSSSGSVTGVTEQYFPLGYGVPDPFYVLAHTPPEILLLSPLNQTYFNSTVALVFTVDKPVNWTRYSLDGALNVTMEGNTTLTELPKSAHSVTVYAEDAFGNVGSSETVWFSVAEPFPVVPVAAASAAAVAVAVAGLLMYFRRRRR